VFRGLAVPAAALATTALVAATLLGASPATAAGAPPTADVRF